MNRITRFTIRTFKLFTANLNKQYKYINIQPGKYIPIYSFLWYFTKKENPDSPNVNLMNKIIIQADELFEEERYLEVYNLLSSYNKTKNIAIEWRICRALYKMSRTDIYDKHTKHAMILEAFDIINKAIIENENDSDIQKWMAILLDAKLSFESRFSYIEDKILIKNHLTASNSLNPNDFTVLYMLGVWHYKICTLNWFQKKIAAYLYHEIPNCTYEDALSYFLKAEELKPRYFLSNIYMLGKVNYQIGNMYRAHYYLTLAAQMTPNTDQEEEYVKSARNLITELKCYDISEEAL